MPMTMKKPPTKPAPTPENPNLVVLRPCKFDKKTETAVDAYYGRVADYETRLEDLQQLRMRTITDPDLTFADGVRIGKELEEERIRLVDETADLRQERHGLLPAIEKSIQAAIEVAEGKLREVTAEEERQLAEQGVTVKSMRAYNTNVKAGERQWSHYLEERPAILGARTVVVNLENALKGVQGQQKVDTARRPLQVNWRKCKDELAQRIATFIGVG